MLPRLRRLRRVKAWVVRACSALAVAGRTFATYAVSLLYWVDARFVALGASLKAVRLGEMAMPFVQVALLLVEEHAAASAAELLLVVTRPGSAGENRASSSS